MLFYYQYQLAPKQTIPFASMMEENACALLPFPMTQNFGVLFSSVQDSQLIRILSGISIIHNPHEYIGAQMIPSNSTTGSTGHCIWPSFGF